MMHSKVYPRCSFYFPFADLFLGHKQAFEVCGVLHRDVSGGNILILPKGGGLLNDWDMAVKIEEAKLGPRAHERTVSLVSPPIKHHSYLHIGYLGFYVHRSIERQEMSPQSQRRHGIILLGSTILQPSLPRPQ